MQDSRVFTLTGIIHKYQIIRGYFKNCPLSHSIFCSEVAVVVPWDTLFLRSVDGKISSDRSSNLLFESQLKLSVMYSIIPERSSSIRQLSVFCHSSWSYLWPSRHSQELRAPGRAPTKPGVSGGSRIDGLEFLHSGFMSTINTLSSFYTQNLHPLLSF